MKQNYSFLLGLLMLFPNVTVAQSVSLKSGFVEPPMSARPRVWWHWMNGNISKDGIRKDLLWMNRVGIGGFHNFDAGMKTPQVVPHRIVYMTPEWKDCFTYAIRLADSLKMEATIAGAPGWSNTGGPWVKPENAMKKLVWRELVVDGGKVRKIVLPEPYSVSGTYQNVPAGGTAKQAPFYKDIAVLAVRIPEAESSMAQMGARITSNTGSFAPESLTDGDVTTSVSLPAEPSKGLSWIQVEFARPYTIKSVSIGDDKRQNQWRTKRAAPNKYLEASVDGVTYKKVCDIPTSYPPLLTMNIPATTAKYFRVVWKSAKKAVKVSEIAFHTVSKVNHSEEKAAFATPADLYKWATAGTSDAIKLSDIADLTSSLQADGTVIWRAPKGRWRIYRFGYSLTGKQNHPASPEATGLEVDKMDAGAVRNYIEYYLDMYKEASGGMLGTKGIRHLLLDSYEAGVANWTANMRDEFMKHRGYDMTPWMPALAGTVIESAEKTDRFLFDFRKTIGELIADNLYGTISGVVKDRGMESYFESHESSRVYLADGMSVKKHASVPMGAVWATWMLMDFDDMSDMKKQQDIYETASTAHVYGQNIVAAESMTAGGLDRIGLAYRFYPGNLKPTADLEFACGVNRFVIHDSAHQPVDDKIPGQGLQIYGQWFHRHETWAELAKPWIDYISRSSHMLQQGNFVADVAYYYGEDNNITGLYEFHKPPVPATTSWDYINTDALCNVLGCSNGRITTPSGMKYRMLALDKNASRITVPALRKIAEMARQGAVICGQVPEECLSLADDTLEFAALVKEIWHSGRKNVYGGRTIESVMQATDILPDFTSTDMDSIRFVHRATPEADIYWLNNRTHRHRTMEATFRVTGRKPMKWNPETGETSELAYTVGARSTKVDLQMLPGDAYFVVFEGSAEVGSSHKPMPKDTIMVKPVEGDWVVNFQKERGAPATATFSKLASYTENADKGIKYFSGTAVYTNTVKLTRKELNHGRLVLSLGDVACMAEVVVNGKNLGLLWKKPYDMDITEAVRKGDNKIEVKVTNLWVNRIIGDQQPDCEKKYTYTSYPFYKADSPLSPGGLIGPVELRAIDGRAQ